jgi:hypothetical protein
MAQVSLPADPFDTTALFAKITATEASLAAPVPVAAAPVVPPAAGKTPYQFQMLRAPSPVAKQHKPKDKKKKQKVVEQHGDKFEDRKVVLKDHKKGYVVAKANDIVRAPGKRKVKGTEFFVASEKEKVLTKGDDASAHASDADAVEESADDDDDDDAPDVAGMDIEDDEDLKFVDKGSHDSAEDDSSVKAADLPSSDEDDDDDEEEEEDEKNGKKSDDEEEDDDDEEDEESSSSSSAPAPPPPEPAKKPKKKKQKPVVTEDLDAPGAPATPPSAVRAPVVIELNRAWRTFSAKGIPLDDVTPVNEKVLTDHAEHLRLFGVAKTRSNATQATGNSANAIQFNQTLSGTTPLLREQAQAFERYEADTYGIFGSLGPVRNARPSNTLQVPQ